MYYVMGDPSTKPKGYDPMTEAVLLWERDKSVTKTRYNLTPFAISLNELTPGLRDKLPPTDSRLRPDQRHLENGEYEVANAEKLRLEQLQRQYLCLPCFYLSLFPISDARVFGAGKEVAGERVATKMGKKSVNVNLGSLSNIVPSFCGLIFITFAFIFSGSIEALSGMFGKKNDSSSFYVVRDDLLHPLVNGNKSRKLDALLPVLEDNAATDVVTCGGCQSAHAAAVAVSCSERGLKAHILLRGEEPETLTGYNLVSKLYGDVVYVPRSVYAKREEMLAKHAESIVGAGGSIMWPNDVMEASFKPYESRVHNFPRADPINCPEKPKKVAIINEGAGDAIALLGVMRLVKYLSQKHLFGKEQTMKIVVDAGTGTTAVGLALGALSLGLPWEVSAVMLADKIEGYKRKEQSLISEFLRGYTSSPHQVLAPSEGGNGGIVQWVDRRAPRKFGNILKGEVEECRRIAQETGVLVDPIYTLAAWDLATQLSQAELGVQDAKIVMLHTGGTLGMFGLAQRPLAGQRVGFTRRMGVRHVASARGGTFRSAFRRNETRHGMGTVAARNGDGTHAATRAAAKPFLRNGIGTATAPRCGCSNK
ncbi:hypothetical protein SASPL_110988 [Salvia splendens]|uniref:D-cysteine desulfhydrase n=1 Tax=Salvia splendens TaxID=180675 RepID=A0A8X8YB18_SALSN|nr:hypothetical protein SASPL_110988 [Salvia splendens]